MKKLYIFDMGGVLTLNTDFLSDIVNYLNITEEEFFTYTGKNFKRLLNGMIGSEEFWARFSLRYGKNVEEELFGKFFYPRINEKTIDLIRQLKDDSRVVCGTNTIEPHYKYLIKRGDYDIFDAVYASNIIGLSKPDSDFYWYILRKEGINPENTIFVDDIQENVISAQKIGIKSILFIDSDSLRQQIKTFNNCL